MFTELNNILNFDEKMPPGKRSILITESATEGTFLLHHLLSLFLKGGNNACLVSFAQSFNHYNNVAVKLGVNLNSAQENGNFVFVGGLKALGGGLSDHCTSKSEQVDVATDAVEMLFRSGKDNCAKYLYETIENSYKSLKNWQTVPSLLLIDDMSLLVHLGIPPQELVWLMQYLQTLTCSTPEGKGCLASLIHRDKECEDNDLNFLMKNLQHKSDIILHVVGLPTGYSKEVHGQLHIRWNNVEQTEPSITTTRIVQYKIGDKNVSFFAKGMSSAVL